MNNFIKVKSNDASNLYTYIDATTIFRVEGILSGCVVYSRGMTEEYKTYSSDSAEDVYERIRDVLGYREREFSYEGKTEEELFDLLRKSVYCV